MLVIAVAVPYTVRKDGGKTIDQAHGFCRPLRMVEDVARQQECIGSSVGDLLQEALQPLKREKHAEMHVAELRDRIARERRRRNGDVVATLDRRIPLVEIAVERRTERRRRIRTRRLQDPAPPRILGHGERPAIDGTKDDGCQHEEKQEHQREEEDRSQRNSRTIRKNPCERIAPREEGRRRDGEHDADQHAANKQRTPGEKIAQRPERRHSEHCKNGD